ncbi:LysR family transcriptional regulator [Ideonella livida]|uniref:LysR family transcriptional regulator n=1 Tax=Ideonella livida TaxID=2707176 RepID=A0A7C9PH68_9BURK|nr:LysR substrate-binding domain-containing protein [Ideonella livida]NDY91855.1 LysR family transcriptional regulator [Ideonella livida]
MNLRQIEVFRAVMSTGSVTQAARLLHVSQPGISRMLAHIELQLGLRLFERGRGRLRPTPEALALHEEVEQVYRGVQRIDERAQALRTGAGLTLRLLCSPSMALQVVPQAVARLVRGHPGLRVVLQAQLLREMSAQLVRQEADLAISTLPVAHPLLQAERLGHWTLGLVCPPDHRLAGREAVGLADLAGEALVGFAADTPQGQLLAALAPTAAAGGPVPALEVRSGQVACALVASGAGVAVVDRFTAQAQPPGVLVWRPLRESPRHPVFALRHVAQPPSAPAQALLEGVRQALQADGASVRPGQA